MMNAQNSPSLVSRSKVPFAGEGVPRSGGVVVKNSPPMVAGCPASPDGVVRPISTHPHLTLITNHDLPRRALCRLARIIYAETRAESLADVEALASMIANIRKKQGRDLTELSEDPNAFECLNRASGRHADLLIRYESPALQMCRRTLQRALTGVLPDGVRGATRFHRAELLPEWATAIGSIHETPNLHFYI